MMRKKKSEPTSLSRERILAIFKKENRTLAFGDLVYLFDARSREKRELKALIQSLVKEGSIIRLKNQRFGLPHEMNLQPGTLWCTKSGNGFVVPDKEGEKDVFIPSRYIKDAFHGDKVIARVEHSFRGRKEGQIIKVTGRRIQNILGFIRKTRNLLFLTPEDEKIQHHFIIREDPKYKDLSNGDLVAGKVTRFPEDGREPECKIIHVFRGLDDIKSISKFVTYKYNLPQRFKKTTETEAAGLSFGEADGNRLDLRTTPHVTIDGEFAKDFDDAIFVEKTRTGYTLYVSIADVSHYVKPGSGLDNEAYQRGTSIYFPGSVIPMLPKALSNVLCSLNPNEDRLAMSVILKYRQDGSVVETTFHKSLIRSARRLTYKSVEAALVQRDAKTRKDLKDLLPSLEHMKELASLLAEGRARRESLDFDLPEPEVILSIEGGIKDILRSERLFSQQIIEEFMIAANEAVAGFFAEHGIPGMFRIHEPPDREKLHDFERLLHTLAIEYRKNKRGLPMQAILGTVHGTPYEFLVNRVLLRSMKQARYSAINKGHFGLASENYLHFTSPIRRYPDLVCHRILKHALDNPGARQRGPEDEKNVANHERLERMASHLSDRERLAMDAERELENRIRVLFMKERIGNTYEGIISHITSYGFFVELFDVFVEGIVLLSTLHDDYYAFQEDKFRLLGRRTKKVYRIGDRVRITVAMADVEKNLLHFSLA
jgi:ribonuclease R